MASRFWVENVVAWIRSKLPRLASDSPFDRQSVDVIGTHDNHYLSKKRHSPRTRFVAITDWQYRTSHYVGVLLRVRSQHLAFSTERLRAIQVNTDGETVESR